MAKVYAIAPEFTVLYFSTWFQVNVISYIDISCKSIQLEPKNCSKGKSSCPT